MHYVGKLVHYIGKVVHYIGKVVHYIGKVVHYIGNKVPFGTRSMSEDKLPTTTNLALPFKYYLAGSDSLLAASLSSLAGSYN